MPPSSDAGPDAPAPVSTAASARRWTWRKLVPLAVFVALTFLLMPKALTGQATFEAVDLVETSAPYRDAIGRPPNVVSPIQTDQTEGTPTVTRFWEALRHGHWLTWEPRVAGGMPLGTLPVFGLLSPLNLGFLFLPAWYAVTLRAFLALLVCQGFTYLFLRRVGIAPLVATVGAVAYAFNGTNMVFLQRVEAVFVFPLLMWCVERALERASVGRLLALGGVTTWLWFEGFPAGFFYCLYFAGAWAAWRLWRTARRRRAEGEPAAAVARAAVVRGAALAVGVGWGVALAAVNLVPFLVEVQRRNLLAARHYSIDAHLPRIQVFGLLDLAVNGPPLRGPWWSGLNPVESVSLVGSVVLVAAAAGLVVSAWRGLRVPPVLRDAWGFCAVGAAALTAANFRGGPVLAVLYRVPGIADNPIQRTRFLLDFCFVVLAAITLDALWARRGARVRERAEPEGSTGAGERAGRGERTGRVVSALSLAALVLIAGPDVDDLLRAADRASQLRELAGGLAWGLVAVAVSAVVVVVGRRGHRQRVVATGVLCAVLFLQLAWPLRAFTPQAPVRDFYRRTPAQTVLEQLTAGEYRFAASAFNFYPNSASLFDLYDLRGIALYSDEFRRLLQAASPTTFDRDRLKQVMPTDEYELTSPVYDDVALRYFAIGTDEQPFGTVVPIDSSWSGWLPTSAGPVTRTFTVPAAGLSGFMIPVQGAADCVDSDLDVELRSGGAVLDVTSRPARDAAGTWLPFAATGASIPAGETASISITADPACGAAIGASVSAPGQAAVQAIVDDPSDGLTLAATEQAWIYERPNARTLVTTHGTWQTFRDQESLLEWLKTRTDPDVAAVVTGPTTGCADCISLGAGADGTVTTVDFGSGEVAVDVTATDPQLVVVAQNAASGWQVTVDGEPAVLADVDGALLGVVVPPGTHHVVFEYRPAAFAIGRAISLAALAAGMAALAVSVWVRRRDRSRSAGRAAPVTA